MVTRLNDWYRTLRAANLPTVWADVLLGAGLAAGTIGWNLAAVTIGVSCLYLGGMAFNDAVDVAFDRANRSTRPVASGRISSRLAMAVASMLMLAGFALIAGVWLRGGGVTETGPAASVWTMHAGLALVVAISLYQWLHRGSVVLATLCMAACRALVPLLTSLAVSGGIPTLVWIAAAAIGCWTVGITLTGRGERGGERVVSGNIIWLSVASLATVPLAFLSVTGDFAGMAAGLFILLVGLLPVIYRRYTAGQLGQAVCWSIAGLAVLDSAILLSCGLPEWSAAAMVCAALALGGQRLGGGS
jgi:hypothetical protein